MNNYEIKNLKPLDYKSGQDMVLKNRICKEAEWKAISEYGRISKEFHEKRIERELDEDLRLSKKIFMLIVVVIVVSSLMGIWEY